MPSACFFGSLLNVRSHLWYAYKNWREVNILYTARCSDRSLIHSLTASKRCKKTKYWCPDCDQPVRLKTGVKVRPHFAHIHSCSSSGESRWHQAAKLTLYKLFSEQQLFVATEHFLPRAGRRADVYVTLHGKPYVFECQASSISQEEMNKRKQDYEQAGAELIWILMPVTRKTGVQRQSVTVLKRGALWPSSTPYYWTLNPQSNILQRHSGCSSDSPAYWTEFVRSFRIKDQDPEWFIRQRAPVCRELDSAVRTGWRRRAPSHRMRRFKHSDLSGMLLQQLLADFRLPPHAYPALARVPFPGSGALSVAPEIWQTLLHVSLIRQRGRSVTISEAWALIHQSCQRFLLPMDRFHLRSMLVIYFSFLEKWGVVVRRYPGVFIIKQPITVVKSADQLLMDDQYVALKSSFVYKNN